MSSHLIRDCEAAPRQLFEDLLSAGVVARLRPLEAAGQDDLVQWLEAVELPFASHLVRIMALAPFADAQVPRLAMIQEEHVQAVAARWLPITKQNIKEKTEELWIRGQRYGFHFSRARSILWDECRLYTNKPDPRANPYNALAHCLCLMIYEMNEMAQGVEPCGVGTR